MHAHEVPAEIRGGEQQVLATTGDKVATVCTQPEREPAGVRVGQCGFDVLRRLPGLGSVMEQPTDRGTYVAASRDSREQIEAVEHLVLCQGLEQSEAECGAADAPTRQRQAPGAGVRGRALGIGQPSAPARHHGLNGVV